MIIKTRLSENDFVRANITLVYQRILVRILTACWILLALLQSLTYMLVDTANGFDILLLIILLFFFPVIAFVKAKYLYKKNPQIGETVTYEIMDNRILCTGETYRSTITWNKILKVKQTNKWIFLWFDKQYAASIHKRDFWEGERGELKINLDKHGIKNNL
ncbi:MAG: YcxB family protein [Ferruginibacter sp.]